MAQLKMYFLYLPTTIVWGDPLTSNSVSTRIMIFFVGNPKKHFIWHYYWEGGRPKLYEFTWGWTTSNSLLQREDAFALLVNLLRVKSWVMRRPSCLQAAGISFLKHIIIHSSEPWKPSRIIIYTIIQQWFNHHQSSANLSIGGFIWWLIPLS